MKIKNFIAPDISSAMDMVRQELGLDAVIISNETKNGEVYITAAVEEKNEFSFNDEEELQEREILPAFDEAPIRESLEYHGVLEVIRSRILARCRKIAVERGLKNPREVLERCFAEMYRFSNILNTENPLKMFMGTPGSGKSTAIAKTAAQAKFRAVPVCIISTDNVRAGANQQLQAFAKILETDFLFCKGERSLYETARKAAASYRLVLIDTPGINPFVKEQVAKISTVSETVKADCILTMDAGRNPCDAAEAAEVFYGLGARFIMPTRLDLTRRIGALLTVADCCDLGFCSASVSDSIANGLAPLDSRSLAGLVLPE